MPTFVVTVAVGDHWQADKPVRAQALWPEHAAFIDGLFAEGYLLLGGPYADNSGAHLIFQADDAETVARLLRDDPWQQHGLHRPPVIREWVIFVNRWA